MLVDGFVMQSIGTHRNALGRSFDGPTALILPLPIRTMAIPAAPTPVTAGS